MEHIELLYTYALYGGISYMNSNINVKSRKYSKYIEDTIIKYFLISFVIYLCYYFYNICINKDENNYGYSVSLWNQLNTRGFLIISIFGLYLKYMPMNIFSLILFAIALRIYYPLFDLVVNYIYNGFFTPDKNNITKALYYSKLAYTKSIVNPITDLGYNIQLNTDDSSEIIVYFRGTDNDKNKITDITIIDEKYYINSNQYVNIHSGFLNAYLSVKDDIFNKCIDLLNKGATKIFITGHSLGGAIAKICIFDIILNINKLNISSDNVSSIQIGSPTVGSNNFNNIYDMIVKNTFEVIHINDPIPKLLNWYYKPTKNIYTVFSNNYDMESHMLWVYKNCIDNKNDNYTIYINRLLINTPIILLLMYLSRNYYIKNNILYD
jgi:hypothetical protein